VQFITLFIRSVLLARFLSPEVFGIYAFAQAIVVTTKSLPAFGLGTAYVHRSPESEHSDALSVYFTLITVFTLLWAMALASGAFLVDHEHRWVLWVLIATTFIFQLTAPANAVMVKRVSFRRPAILSLVTALLSTPIAIFLAWSRRDVWSLLSIDLITSVISVAGYYVIDPVWRPKFTWSRPVARYFLKFGGHVVLSGTLSDAMDRLDNLWTGQFLGDVALGFYSQAYTFASSISRGLISPVFAVVVGVFAEVKQDRGRLSRAFFWVNALVIRGSFLLGGMVFLASPEFVQRVLGEQWLPMLGTFQLMTSHILLYPVGIVIGSMFPAIGRPETLVRTRLVQLGILIAGLVTLGPAYGIKGVAIAVISMVVTGLGILLWQAHKHVDFSLTRLFGIPVIALASGLLIAYGLTSMVRINGPSWQVTVSRLGILGAVYVAIVFLTERRQVIEILQLLQQLFSQHRQAGIVGSD
jgi:O-antigen/teichoic acid export membrane protein